jgi:hypothetical protein
LSQLGIEPNENEELDPSVRLTMEVDNGVSRRTLLGIPGRGSRTARRWFDEN